MGSEEEPKTPRPLEHIPITQLEDKLWKIVTDGKPKNLQAYLEEFSTHPKLSTALKSVDPELDEDGGNTVVYCVKVGRDKGSTFGGKDHGSCIALLVENGADVDHVDKAKRTALSWAVYLRYHNYVKRLLKLGADVTIADQDGYNPFQIAIQSGSKDMVTTIIDHDNKIIDLIDENGAPPLVTAVRHKQLDICRLLLDRGADVNLMDQKEKRSAVYYAIKHKLPDLLDLLLKHKPRLDTIDCKGQSILYLCCELNDTRYFHKVINYCPKFSQTIMDQPADDEKTPVIVACQNGNSEQLKHLLENGASVQAHDTSGKTALHHCADNLETQCAEMLLDHDKSILEVKDEQGYTALALAVLVGNVNLIKLLLEKGANIGTEDNEGHKLSHWAAVCGHLKVLDILVNNNAEMSSPDNHHAYPIHYAAQMNGANSGNTESRISEKVLRKFIDCKVELDVLDDAGRQPLLWAACSGNADSCRLLLKAGSDINSTDQDSLTALHCAASRGHYDCIEVLRKGGADVNLIDKNRCTPLFYAITLGNKDCTQALIKAKADVNHVDDRGRNPVHCAAIKGCLDTVKLLEKEKADTWHQNNKGDYPIHEAAQKGHSDVVKFFLNQKNDREAVNVTNKVGKTLLHIAAATNNLPLCKLLINADADKNALMKHAGKEFTPYDIAVLKGHKDTAEFLKKKGSLAYSDLSNIEKRESKSARSRKSARSNIVTVNMDSELNIQKSNEKTVSDNTEDKKVSKTPKSTPTPTPKSSPKHKVVVITVDTKKDKNKQTKENVDKDKESDVKNADNDTKDTTKDGKKNVVLANTAVGKKTEKDKTNNQKSKSMERESGNNDGKEKEKTKDTVVLIKSTSPSKDGKKKDEDKIAADGQKEGKSSPSKSGTQKNEPGGTKVIPGKKDVKTTGEKEGDKNDKTNTKLSKEKSLQSDENKSVTDKKKGGKRSPSPDKKDNKQTNQKQSNSDKKDESSKSDDTLTKSPEKKKVNETETESKDDGNAAKTEKKKSNDKEPETEKGFFSFFRRGKKEAKSDKKSDDNEQDTNEPENKETTKDSQTKDDKNNVIPVGADSKDNEEGENKTTSNKQKDTGLKKSDSKSPVKVKPGAKKTTTDKKHDIGKVTDNSKPSDDQGKTEDKVRDGETGDKDMKGTKSADNKTKDTKLVNGIIKGKTVAEGKQNKTTNTKDTAKTKDKQKTNNTVTFESSHDNEQANETKVGVLKPGDKSETKGRQNNKSVTDSTTSQQKSKVDNKTSKTDSNKHNHIVNQEQVTKGSNKGSNKDNQSSQGIEEGKDFTPYDLAVIKGYQEAADYLKSKGALPHADVTNIDKEKEKKETPTTNDKDKKQTKNKEKTTPKKQLTKKSSPKKDSEGKTSPKSPDKVIVPLIDSDKPKKEKEEKDKEKEKIDKSKSVTPEAEGSPKSPTKDKEVDKKADSPKPDKSSPKPDKTITAKPPSGDGTDADKLQKQLNKKPSADSVLEKEDGIRTSTVSLRSDTSARNAVNRKKGAKLANGTVSPSSSMGSSVGKKKDTGKYVSLERTQTQVPDKEQTGDDDPHQQGRRASKRPQKGQKVDLDNENADSGTETDRDCHSRPKHPFKVTSKPYLDQVQESVWRYQTRRSKSRRLNQMKRAQIHTGPMHDIVMFSKMMDNYRKGLAGEEEEAVIRNYANWDGYLNDELRFVSHLYNEEHPETPRDVQEVAQEQHHMLEVEAQLHKNDSELRCKLIEADQEYQRKKNQDMDKEIDSLATRTAEMFDNVKTGAAGTLASAKTRNVKLRDNMRKSREERIQSATDPHERAYLQRQELEDRMEDQHSEIDRERKERYRQWHRHKDEEMRRRLLQAYRPYFPNDVFSKKSAIVNGSNKPLWLPLRTTSMRRHRSRVCVSGGRVKSAGRLKVDMSPSSSPGPRRAFQSPRPMSTKSGTLDTTCSSTTAQMKLNEKTKVQMTPYGLRRVRNQDRPTYDEVEAELADAIFFNSDRCTKSADAADRRARLYNIESETPPPLPKYGYNPEQILATIRELEQKVRRHYPTPNEPRICGATGIRRFSSRRERRKIPHFYESSPVTN